MNMIPKCTKEGAPPLTPVHNECVIPCRCHRTNAVNKAETTFFYNENSWQ